MSFLRNVLHDLVEKKLWPVAVALLLALVAVPVVLGGGADTSDADQAAAPAPAAPAKPAPAAQVVSLQAQAGAVKREGKGSDPFVQHHLPKPVKAVTSALQSATAVVGGSSTGGSSSGGSRDSATSGGGTPAGSTTPSTGRTTTPKKTTPKKTTTTSTNTYKVNVRFGESGSERTIKDIARLTPLPSSTDPFFVFMGIKEDGETAVFLISSDAVPSGDGVCKPSADACDTLELKVGDTEFFDLQTGTAGVVQYQLELTSITKSKASNKATAAVAHQRESKAGREAVRAIVASNPDVLAGWDFAKHLGVLIERKPDTAQAGDAAHVPADVAVKAQGLGGTGTLPAPTPAPAP